MLKHNWLSLGSMQGYQEKNKHITLLGNTKTRLAPQWTQQLGATKAITTSTSKRLDLRHKWAKRRQLSWVQFSCSVVFDSLWPHELQHARPPCPSPTPGVHPNPCLLCQWCHPTISSSVIPFSSCPQSFPASGSFPMSQLFASGGQNTGVSASTSVLPMNTHDWSPLGWTGWSPCSPRDSQESSPTPHFKSINSLAFSFLYGPILTSIHDYWKNHSFD